MPYVEQPVVKKNQLELKNIDPNDREILRNFSSSDETLNNHVLGNIPLKLVDFSKQRYYQMLEIKIPDCKKQIYE